MLNWSYQAYMKENLVTKECVRNGNQAIEGDQNFLIQSKIGNKYSDLLNRCTYSLLILG